MSGGQNVTAELWWCTGAVPVCFLCTFSSKVGFYREKQQKFVFLIKVYLEELGRWSAQTLQAHGLECNTQYPHEKPGMVENVSNPRNEGEESRRYLGLTGHPACPDVCSLRPTGRLSQSKAVAGTWEVITEAGLWLPHTCACTHTSTHPPRSTFTQRIPLSMYPEGC